MNKKILEEFDKLTQELEIEEIEEIDCGLCVESIDTKITGINELKTFLKKVLQQKDKEYEEDKEKNPARIRLSKILEERTIDWKKKEKKKWNQHYQEKFEKCLPKRIKKTNSGTNMDIGVRIGYNRCRHEIRDNWNK